VDFKYEIIFSFNLKKKKEIANILAAVARSSYCIVANNALRAYESYRPGKKNFVDITGDMTVTCTLFCAQSNVHTRE